MSIIRRLLFKIYLLVEKIELNAEVHVWIPQLKRSYLVVVSSVKSSSFTARWIDGVEPDEVYMYEWTGQLDNDIAYSLESREPLDSRGAASV